MDKFKQQIQQRLVANIIMDKCARSEYLIFRDAWCTQDRILRFTTHFFREIFPVRESETGKWKTGDSVMYEIYNGVDSFVVSCVLSSHSAAISNRVILDRVLKTVNAAKTSSSDEIVLKKWDISNSAGDANILFESFDHLIYKDIPLFEQDLKEKLDSDVSVSDEFHEGSEQTVISNRFERNPKARAACIAAHGTACTVCGIDFGKTYGPEFAGKIEVHHIVPISEIGEDYIVDPVCDLVPVCPNCHTALHSKKNGVYTIEELKAIRNRSE